MSWLSAAMALHRSRLPGPGIPNPVVCLWCHRLIGWSPLTPLFQRYGNYLPSHRELALRTLRFLAWSLLCLAALPALADDLTDQIRAGREKSRPCTTCHGLNGQRQGGEMPAIGGRDYFDLLYQMGRFRRADRFHPAMTVLLQTYDVADMADVAAYFASMDSTRLVRPGPYQP